MTEEIAFLEHNFLPPTLRRRIALLGFCHKVALGPNFCHPTLVAALPCTEDHQGAKVFECYEESCTEFKDRLWCEALFRFPWLLFLGVPLGDFWACQNREIFNQKIKTFEFWAMFFFVFLESITFDLFLQTLNIYLEYECWKEFQLNALN